MQISFAVVIGLLATSISAIPTRHQQSSEEHVTVQFTNDLTGASASASIQISGRGLKISHLLKDTNIDSHGKIVASSIQMTKIVQGVHCYMTDHHDKNIADITDTHTFSDLDGNPNAAKPIRIEKAHILCKWK
ncbi:hypothetical protein EMCG_07060 [[Emmonsia] crescens]|uniref:Uncharacterized protein n=1 Tax=[Emmonsia] crescens TaxID=73230 RepID=A0A0G2IAF4_9EURO|nr:hypothetical protein EMCG_07060 [Emmonsia crescens UAMH 3008]